MSKRSRAYLDGVQAELRTGPYAEFQSLKIQPRIPYVTDTKEESDWLAGFKVGSRSGEGD